MATELCSSQPGHLCCTKAAVPIAYKYHTEEVSLLPAGLYLPTSDVDLVILDSGCTDIVSGLRALAQCLVRRSLATGIQVGIRPLHLRCIHHRSSFRKVSLVCSLLTCPSGFPIKTELVLPLPGVKLMHWLPCWGYIAYHGLKLAQCSVLVRDNSESFPCHVQIIAKAKVPIIKFKEAASGLNFDVSFNAANGPQAAEYVRELMQRLPPMRSLILVIKVFLHQRELNEVGPHILEAFNVQCCPTLLGKAQYSTICVDLHDPYDFPFSLTLTITQDVPSPLTATVKVYGKSVRAVLINRASIANSCPGTDLLVRPSTGSGWPLQGI